MGETVDVLVIGGGIAGACTAYFLACEGIHNVLVLERSAVAAGASGRASGLVSFLAAGNKSVADILKASSDFYASWQDEIHAGPAINTVGGMALAPASERDGLEQQAAVMRDAGHDVRILDRAELAALLPRWDLADVDVAAYSPVSGYIDPSMVTTAVMNRARSMGVRVYHGDGALGFLVEGSRVTGAKSTRGNIAAGATVLAAGAWTRHLGAMVGADLPVWGVRHQVMHLRPPGDLRQPFPGCVDPMNSLYFRPEPGGLVLAANSGPDDYPGEPPGDPDRFDPSVSDWYARWISARLARRIPAMAEAEIVGGHAGVYPKGPDDFPLLGEVPGTDGLYCICDTAGGGMTSSPGLARALVETIVRGSAFTDVHPFRPSRFAEGAAHAEPFRLAHSLRRSSWSD